MTATKLIVGILATLVMAALTTPMLMAQSLVSGDITGTVMDPSGAVVPNATVTLKSDATGETRTATSNSSGAYRFALLRPGTYMLSAEAKGFSKAQTSVVVNVGQTSINNVKMALGASSQTVEVTSAAPLVQADNADLSSNFNQTLIADQPNGGNDLTYVAQTAPGVMMNTGMGYGNFSSYGLPATSNLFTVNGENDMDPYLNLNNSGATNLTLGKNELQEATVVNNAYSGQYGQQAGAQVSYVTKSGTNQYHGNLEYWWTGSSLDANDWFNNHTDPVTPRPFANNNQYAASFGGPIKKDKTFFFLDTEGLRYIVPSSQPVYVPTPAFISQTLANLSATAPNEVGLYSKLFNLYTSAPGYNGTNYIPGSCGGVLNTLNPVFASNNNCFSTYQATPSLPSTEWILSGRIDQNFSDNDHVFFRVKADHGTQATLADPFSSALSAASYQPAYDGQAQWNHVFTPGATNQFIAALSHYQAIFTQNDPSVFPYSIISTGFNLGNTSGITSYAFDFPQGRNVTQYQFIDDFSWTKGAHSLKFGGNFRRYDVTDYAFSVLNNPEILLGDVSGNGDGGQADFYNGIALQTRQRFPSRATEPVALWGLGVYAQDEWRVSKNLKITLALRAEKNSNPVCQTNCAALLTGDFNTMLSQSLITPDTPYSSMIDANRHQIYRSTDAINLSPRFGFAWSPLGNDSTVIRGGFGIFYDAQAAVIGDQFMLNLPGLVSVYSTGVPWGDTTSSGPYAQGLASAQAIMSGFANGATYNSLVGQLGSAFKTPTFNSQVGTFHTPQYQQWSLQFQQGFGDKSVLSLGYVGNHGIYIPVYNQGLNAYMNPAISGYNIPPFPTTPPTGCGNASCSQSATFANVQQYYSGAVSNYNGLTASFNQRMTHGLTLQLTYTWSHANDDVSNSGVGATPYNGDTSLSYQINPSCLTCNNYGNSDYDIRHYLSASYVWQMPFKFGNRFANATLGGWTMSQNFFLRSGLPLTVIDGNSFISNWTPSSGNNLAEVVGFGQQTCTNGNSQCLLPGDFTSATTSFPNQRRNMWRGPGFFDSDLSVNKNFKITERFLLNLGANFYNIFNHPNFANPDDNLADTTFGQIQTTTASPTGPYGSFFTGLPSGRIIQFQGKITF